MSPKFTKALFSAVILVSLIIITNCGNDDTNTNDGDQTTDGDAVTEEFTLTSSAFVDGGKIPEKYGCTETQDKNRPSIPLSWVGVPEGTKTLVLLFDDPDTVADYWVHWVMINIPASVESLSEDSATPAGASVLPNSWNESDFGGPCPPNGTHNYRFQLFAMSQESITLETSGKKGDELTDEISAMNPLGVATLRADYP